MAKEKNLNKHKGREHQKLIKRKSLPRYSHKGNGAVRTELTFICIDTCTFIDLYERRSSLKRDDQYYSKLQSIKEMSLLKSDGNINPRGKIVLCMTQSAISELSINGQVMYKYRTFFQNRILPLDVAPELEKQFHKQVKLLVQQYNEHGLFLDKEGNTTMDGINTAQATLLNAMFISRDHHVVSKKGTKLFENKPEIIQQINEAFLKKYSLIPTNENAPAKPIPKTSTVESFLKRFAKGGLSPNPTDAKFLSEDTKKIAEYFVVLSKCKKVPENLENPLKEKAIEKKVTVKIVKKEPALTI